jgi:acetyl-CoA decarbonylase/synthase complex subunit delta
VNKNTTPNTLVDAQKFDCDIIALKFENLEAIENLKNLLPHISKPLMICATGDDEIDKILLPEVIKLLDRECIISDANEQTYKEIIPSVISGNHYIVLKSPIDINLAKELNILSVDMGLDKSKIIMNTDIGGLGYGYEYGFSIMEKVIQEGKKGDEYLEFPLFSDASGEALKTKEARSEDYSASYGNLKDRRKMIELTACAGIIAAGANIIMVNIPENITILKGLV